MVTLSQLLPSWKKLFSVLWTLLSFEVASHQATKSDEGELCRLDVGFSVVLTPFHTIAHFSNEAK